MSSYVTNDVWESKLKKYQWDSFIDVLTMGKSPLTLVAHPSSKVNTPQDFVKLISTTTKPINIAVGGGAHRTAYEYLMEKGHGKRDLIKPIKFNGPMPAVVSVSTFDGSNGTEFGIMPIAVARSLVEAGKVKIIGFTGTRKMTQYPNVPLLNTVAPGINVYAAWSIQLPPGAPADVVAWYQREFARAIQSAEYQSWATDSFIFTDSQQLTPQGTARYAEQLRRSFAPIIKKLQ